jgi:hypothetical protein
VIDRDDTERIRGTLPELRAARKERLLSTYP